MPPSIISRARLHSASATGSASSTVRFSTCDACTMLRCTRIDSSSTDFSASCAADSSCVLLAASAAAVSTSIVASSGSRWLKLAMRARLASNAATAASASA